MYYFFHCGNAVVNGAIDSVFQVIGAETVDLSTVVIFYLGGEVMQKQAKRKPNWFGLLLVLIFTYFGYVGIQQQLHINEIDHEREIAEIRLAEARQENETLQKEREKLQQAAYIEKLAREELGLVKPGEMPYISSN